MKTQHPGILHTDANGFFHMYAPDDAGCWHYDTPCDGTCAVAGDLVPGFQPTNALLVALARAATLGYRV